MNADLRLPMRELVTVIASSHPGALKPASALVLRDSSSFPEPGRTSPGWAGSLPPTQALDA